MPTISYRPLTIAALLTSAALLSVPASAQSVPAAEKARAPVRVQTVTLSEFAPAIVLTGEVVARNELPLSFTNGGRVIEVAADVGDHVEKGTVLARLEAGVQEASVQAAKAGVAAAQAALDQASNAFQRTQSLFESGVSTRSALEQAQTAEQTARSQFESATAQLDTAQKSLSDAVLVATESGIIIERQVSTGEIAAPGVTAFLIAEDGPRDAKFFVPETVLLSQISEEPGVIYSLDDPTARATGALQSVSPNLDPATGSIQVKFEISDATKDLGLGTAIVGTTKVKPVEAIVLPWTALWSIGSDPAVWVVNPTDSSVSLQPVTVKVHTTGSVVISAGLDVGTVVVVDGAKMLHPGQIVMPVEE